MSIFDFGIDRLPHSVIINGLYGSGRHDMVFDYAKKNGIDVENITDKISLDTLTSIEQYGSLIFCVVDAEYISEREQNVLLKFTEEPLKNVFIFYICEDLGMILPTIKNRCQIVKSPSFTESELMKFVDASNEDSEYLHKYFKYCNTPGKIEKCTIQNFRFLDDMSEKLLQYIETITLSNILFLPTKIDVKNNHFNLSIFTDVLQDKIFECHKNGCMFNSGFINFSLSEIAKLKNNLHIRGVEPSVCFNDFLISLKEYGLENGYKSAKE